MKMSEFRQCLTTTAHCVCIVYDTNSVLNDKKILQFNTNVNWISNNIQMQFRSGLVTCLVLLSRIQMCVKFVKVQVKI